MSRSYRNVEVAATLEGCVGAFYGEVESLADECREVVDGAPEGLSQSERIRTFEETADALEGVRDDQVEVGDLPEDVGATALKVLVQVPTRRGRQPGRAVRCANACAHGRAAVDALEAWIDEKRSELGDDDHPVSAHASLTEQVDAVEELKDKLTEQVDAAEGCEFPGMYG